MINTVKGAIEPSSLGKTLSHEHLILDLRKVRKDTISYIESVDEVINELEIVKKYNVNSIIELTTNDMGRNPLKLLQISEATGLNIICSTGFYLDLYHSDEFKKKSIEEIAEIMVADILIGIDGTGIKAGAIGEIAAQKDKISPSELKVFEAACIASKKIGAAIFTHCQLGQFGMEQINIFKRNNVDLSNVVLGHIDLNSDLDYVLSLLKTGVNIAFDTIGKSSYMSDETRKRILLELLSRGYEDKILISQDVSRRSYFKLNGEEGYEPALSFMDNLLVNGEIDKKISDKIFIDNPARILDIN